MQRIRKNPEENRKADTNAEQEDSREAAGRELRFCPQMRISLCGNSLEIFKSCSIFFTFLLLIYQYIISII